VVVAKVDATEQPDLAQKFDVSGYPTIIYFGKGTEKEAAKYQGARDEAGIVSFINEQAGTHWNVDGSLKTTAGRIVVLDELVKGKAAAADAALLTAVQEAAAVLSAAEQELAERYVGTVKKIIEKGTDYVSKEVKRLGSMLKSSNVSPDKKAGFMLRQNVLNVFLQE
jgi:protein disulfide-isomerase A6